MVIDMDFDINENKEVIALLGAGSMGTAIVKKNRCRKNNIFR